MKSILSVIAGACLAFVFSATGFAETTAANGYTAGTPVPVDYWALRNVINTVEVSPDGKHILVLKTESKEGDHVLEIYKTEDMSKPFRRLNAKPMEFISASWVHDDFIFGTAWQVVRKSVPGPEDDVREYKLYSYNLKSNKFSESSGNFSIVNNLPNEPDKVLVATGDAVGGAREVDPFAAFRPRSYYKFDLKTGRRSLVLKGNAKHPQVSFDNDGNPRYSQSINNQNELVQYYRKPGDSSWKEFGDRYDFDKHENLYRVLGGVHGFVGMKSGNPSVGYIVDNLNGEDKAGLYEFNFDTGQFGRKVFSDANSDVIALQRHSNEWSGNDKAVAVWYSGAKRERHWLDMEEKRLHDSLASNIPNSHFVSITSRSRDGNSMIVQNVGPKDPGSFWYIKDGKMVKLGSRNPLVKPSDLSNVEYIRYPARDGMTIPAYVTKPKGPGPHPLIVLPHGGPHVNEVIHYDEWGQMLANNGYMVLQPQYRISTGWGQKHFDEGFGQHGLAMQDDKDDGAKYLVEKGWVDPNRIAMFGWSYGGYAALVAASRENNIYQCTIAGAAVADAKKVYMKRSGGRTIKAIDDWARARGGYVGINPIAEVEDVNIPVFMIHPEWDRRVLYFNYKDYKAEMEKVAENRSTGKCTGGLKETECTTTLYKSGRRSNDGIVPAAFGDPVVSTESSGSPYEAKHRFLTIKGADHFFITLMYEHQKLLYTEMLDYLKNDCGPGGL